jgi:hypothetical protein
VCCAYVGENRGDQAAIAAELLLSGGGQEEQQQAAPYTLFAGDLNSDSTAEQAGGAADTAVQQLRAVPGLSELVPYVCATAPVSLTFSYIVPLHLGAVYLVVVRVAVRTHALISRHHHNMYPRAD